MDSIFYLENIKVYQKAIKAFLRMGTFGIV